MKQAKFVVHLPELMRKRGIAEQRIITQLVVAQETGLSYPTIQRWHKGSVRRIEAETVAALTAYFKCRMSDLVEIKS